MADQPTDFVNLSDWLSLNREEGQRMGGALNDDVQKYSGQAQEQLGRAQESALRGLSYGGSSDLTSYGNYVSAQRNASEAQMRSGLYGTQHGRQEGLRRAYGSANSLDAALVGDSGYKPMDVSGLQGQFDSARKGVADAGGEYHDWTLRMQAMQEKARRDFEAQQKDREAKGAEAERRKRIIDQYRKTITDNYWYHRGQGRGQEGDWGAPESWTQDQWWEEASRMDQEDNNYSLDAPWGGHGR